jgi:DNA-binding NarL/FixJ family response regulator
MLNQEMSRIVHRGDQAAHDISVLIAARPGRMRDSLLAVLKSAPGISVVGQADCGASALSMIAACCPALALLDTDLPDGQAFAVLEQIKTLEPRCCCLVLADDRHQQQDAVSAGADAALLKGFPAAKLLGVIERLVDGHGAA